MSPLSLISLISLTLAGLATIEGLAWWWMHPATANDNLPVLAYRPGIADRGSKIVDEKDAPASPSPNQKSEIINPQSPISNLSYPSSTDHSSSISPAQRFSVSASTHTPLPEIYREAAPMLRCTSGQVFHVQISDTASLHGAFFEWDDTDTGSVLEAFRHMPEACMGSIGMQLVSKEKPILYQVRRQVTGDSSQKEATASSSAPSSVQKSTIHNPQSSISSSSSNLQLLFDHTVFRDPGQAASPLVSAPLIHVFRAVWISGMSSTDAREGLDGREFDQLRAIRLKAALTRFRPTHARVVQGAVRGMHSPHAAWQAFEQHMLRDLTSER